MELLIGILIGLIIGAIVIYIILKYWIGGGGWMGR